jgi:hypothetical protein
MIAPGQPRAAGERKASMATDVVHRILGGPPVAVVVRLILLSIIVGMVLHAVGLDPWHLRRLVLQVWSMGFDAVRWVWRYFLLGAALVIPIWVVVRLLHAAER